MQPHDLALRSSVNGIDLFLIPGDVKEVIAWFEAGVLSIQLLKSKDPSHLKDKEVLIQ